MTYEQLWFGTIHNMMYSYLEFSCIYGSSSDEGGPRRQTDDRDGHCLHSPTSFSRGGGVGTDSYMAYLRTSHPSGGAKDNILGGALIFHWAGLAPAPSGKSIPYDTALEFTSYAVTMTRIHVFFFFEFEISTMA